MARFLWASFDGGGNVPCALGVGRGLAADGHEVSFVGRPEMVDRIAPTGFRAIELSTSYVHADRYSWHPRARIFSYLTSPAVGDELLAVVARERPDVVVIDAMFGAALAVAPHFAVPTVGILQSFLNRALDGWNDMMGAQSDARRRCGFDPLPPLERLWGDLDLIQVNALEQLDGPPRTGLKNLRYGGPIFEDDDRAAPVRLPWDPADPTPLVLVSFSTADVQVSVGKLQRSLDALAELPVHVVATTGGIDTARLSIAENAYAVQFASHGPLMRRASLLVTHCGHGTVMRAISHGLNMVCVTGKAADQEAASFDQEPIGEFVEEYGVGRSVPAEASVARIRAVVESAITDHEARRNARALAGRLRAGRGAADATRELTALLDPPPPWAREVSA